MLNIPPVPRTPSTTAREALFEIRSTRRVWLIVGIFWSIFGWIIPYLFAQGIIGDVLLSLLSSKATGAITEIKESDGLPINRVYPQSIFYTYSYEGTQLKGLSKTFDTELAKQLQPGQSIELEVLSFYPSLSRVVDTSLSQYGVMGLFTVGFPIFGFILIGIVLGNRRKELEAYQNGTAVYAKCLTAKQKGSQLWFRWEFEVGGRLYFGELTTREHPSLAALLSAKELPVTYDPNDPRANCLYVA